MSSGTTSFQNQISETYSQIDQLWKQLDSGSSGMSGPQAQEVKEHVVTARDALKNATNLISRAS